ncbi:hypothetical protein LV89_01839 [Arcicella aurantiaca]|uniref:Uncharacterized protein n=1 Tax=Arcicella aurantiaca TaxID=591202 RepID=A0A316E9H7_9BACT|nr:hypothetical protein [Arcicella aurantiaca]PWK27027.1 hypothetical protein LV89_01839 [Arcicella aurantiaca]
MAISTDLKTPLTLVKDQALSIPIGTPEVDCFNDSGLSNPHYRTIPNDKSNEGLIKWANIQSAKQQDGEYAVAVSMFEYIPDSGPSSIFLKMLEKAAAEGLLANVPQRGEMYVMPNSVKEESSGHVVFRKIVWVAASDLVLGSVSQQKAIADAEEEKQKKYLESLTKTDTNPLLGNSALGASLGTWGIIGIVLLFVIGLIWGIVALIKKKKEKSKEAVPPPVNVIRIPKSS